MGYDNLFIFKISLIDFAGHFLPSLPSITFIVNKKRLVGRTNQFSVYGAVVGNAESHDPLESTCNELWKE